MPIPTLDCYFIIWKADDTLPIIVLFDKKFIK
jgi:hypothetical protein